MTVFVWKLFRLHRDTFLDMLLKEKVNKIKAGSSAPLTTAKALDIILTQTGAFDAHANSKEVSSASQNASSPSPSMITAITATNVSLNRRTQGNAVETVTIDNSVSEEQGSPRLKMQICCKFNYLFLPKSFKPF